MNNQPLGQGRLSWLFVPRLEADGWFRAQGKDHRIERASTYHDHNWGHFLWGDDFGWEWGSALPINGGPWSFVFMRMTDAHHLKSRSQALYVWHKDEPAAMFRDASIRIRRSGLLRRRPDATLPGAMSVVLGSGRSAVPATLSVDAAHGNDRLSLHFTAENYARIAMPSEIAPNRSVVLNEASGAVSASGEVGGRSVSFDGPSVFEFLDG